MRILFIASFPGLEASVSLFWACCLAGWATVSLDKITMDPDNVYVAVKDIVYLGLKGHVVAVDKKDGATLWQTKLKGGLASGDRFVTLLIEDARVYAHTCGELFCLDADTGEILWNNGLEGLGYDIGSLASEGISSAAAPALAHRRRQEASKSSGAEGTSDGGVTH